MLRSIGVTKSMVIRIYIYEALVLVISCSICGFFIGAVTGNMMILQQALITSNQFVPVIPFSQLQVMVIFALICAVGSTYNAARRLLDESIPDIGRQM